MLEGFNKWAKAGLRAFVTSDLRHFSLPDSLGGTSSYNEHNLSVGGQLIKNKEQRCIMMLQLKHGLQEKTLDN